MTAAALKKTFVDAVTSISQETNAKKAKKMYLKAMLAIHPDKQRNASTKNTASMLSQKLSGIYAMIESNTMPRRVRSNLSNTTFVSNLSNNRAAYDPSTSSEMHAGSGSNSNNNSFDPNWMPGAHSNNENFSPGNYGSRYRPERTYNTRNRTRQRQSGDPVSNRLYKHIQTTNPVLFKRHVLSKIPQKYRPCPPGMPPTNDCQSRIKPMVSMRTAQSHYRKFGHDQYWVGTEHGRRAIAHAISLIQNQSLQTALKNKAMSLGFDVDAELARKRATI